MQYTAYSRVTINGEKADDDAPPFQLATPPGFQVNHIPKGNLVNTYVPGTVFEQKTPTFKYKKVRENKKKGSKKREGLPGLELASSNSKLHSTYLDQRSVFPFLEKTASQYTRHKHA